MWRVQGSMKREVWRCDTSRDELEVSGGVGGGGLGAAERETSRFMFAILSKSLENNLKAFTS